MNKLLIGLIAGFGILLLSNCAPKMTSPDNTQRQWMLVEFQDFTKEMMTQNKATLNLADKENPGKFSANMGCNNMFGMANFKADGTVQISDVGSTMMFCDKAMDLEGAFIKALPSITKYKINGHYLTLMGTNGETMKFVAADWD